MAKLHIYKEFYNGRYRSYCGLSSDDENEFLQRARKGDICKQCIRCRIAHKKRVRSS